MKYIKTQEMCPYCDDVHNYTYKNNMIVKCKTCKKEMLLCSVCEYNDCENCKYEKELEKLC